MLTATELKDRHRRIRDQEPEALRLRIHRALSWLIRSENEDADPDLRFILQWIAMNAAYAREFGREETERTRAKAFLEGIVTLDTDKRLRQALFQQFTGPIRTLIGNKFTYEPFWTAMRTHDASQVNRAQLADAVAILGTLVPLVLTVMMDHPDQAYGDALYPVL